MQSLGGVTLLEVNKADERVVLQFNCLTRFCHTGGTIAQGGFVTAWMDAAMAHAVMLCSDRRQTVASLDINVRFLQACSPGLVTATGWVVRRGRRVANLAAELRNEAGDLIATASSGGMLVSLVSDDS